MPKQTMIFYRSSPQKRNYDPKYEQPRGVMVDNLDFDTDPIVQKPAHWLNKLGLQLMRPLMKTADIIARGKYVTPGIYNDPDLNPNNAKRKALGYAYKIGGALLAPPALALSALSWAFRALATKIDPRPFEYEITATEIGPEQTDFSILTRNTSLSEAVLTNFHNLKGAKERAVELLNSIEQHNLQKKQFDSILLQEVFDPNIARFLVEEFKKRKLFKNFIFNVGPSGYGWNSGLFFATNRKIDYARFVQTPNPYFVGNRYSIESIANKGVLYVAVANGDQFDIYVTTHLKSEIGPNDKTQKANEKLRAESVRILIQGLYDLIKNMEADGKVISKVILGADLNISDRQVNQNYKYTYERTQNKDEAVRALYQNFFPQDRAGLDTWFEAIPPNKDNTGWGQDGFTGKKMKQDVRFDHGGTLLIEPDLHFPGNGPLLFNAQGTTKLLMQQAIVFDDQGAAKNAPISDHAGLAMDIAIRTVRRAGR
jgi:hypothetical protein